MLDMNIKYYYSVSFRGYVFWKSSSANGKLSSLNNKVGVFETEVVEFGNLMEKV
jgi:hypothetical protein